VSRGSRVMRVTGQLTDGSRGLRVKSVISAAVTCAAVVDQHVGANFASYGAISSDVYIASWSVDHLHRTPGDSSTVVCLLTGCLALLYGRRRWFLQS